MLLHDLLSTCRLPLERPEADPAITGIAYDSRKVEPGSLFVCIRGFKTDGHAYAAAAVKAGAAALVVESELGDLGVPQIRTADTRTALAALAAAYYGHPSAHMKVIGITATNGKTSTSFMTDAILRGIGLRTGLVGTVVVKIGDRSSASELTTPESADLQRYFSEMVRAGVACATMEVSSSALELQRAAFVDFDIVSFHNVSREHIDLHASFEQYFRYKSSLITSARPDQVAILNLDDARTAALAEQTAARVVTIGADSGAADIRAEAIDLSTGRARFEVVIPRAIETPQGSIQAQRFSVALGTPGYHSVLNSLVAIAIGLLCGATAASIRESLAAFGGVERRFEMLREAPYKVLDDHFANSGNIEVTLNTLTRMDYENVHLVYAVRGSRGVTVNRENAEAIAKWAGRLGLKEVLATSSVSHVTAKDAVTPEERAAFEAVMAEAGLSVRYFEELPEAIDAALAQVQSGDIVLLAGCQGMDCGGQLALERIAAERPEEEREAILRPLAGRVAGAAH